MVQPQDIPLSVLHDFALRCPHLLLLIPKKLESIFSDAEKDIGSSSPDPTSDYTNLPCFEILHTDKKGFSAFATIELPRGARILTEKPLLRCDYEESLEVMDLYEEFSKLSSQDMETYLGLICAIPQIEQCYMMLSPKGLALPQNIRVAATWASNCFRLFDKPIYGDRKQIGSAVFEKGSRFNHSCLPNLRVEWNGNTGTLNFHCIRDIQPGEELCFQYSIEVASTTPSERRVNLDPYGFKCDCQRCDILTPKGRQSVERVAYLRRLIADICYTREVVRTAGSPMPLHGPVNKTVLNNKSDLDLMSALQNIIDIVKEEGLVGEDLSLCYRQVLMQCEHDGDLFGNYIWTRKLLANELALFGSDHPYTQATATKLAELRQFLLVETERLF